MESCLPASPVNTVPVSVVIPVYGHSDVLERALRSVANQSVRPLEVIIVNDGAERQVDEAITELRQRYRDFGADWLKTISLMVCEGAGPARNMGWALARGIYIAFLDADDVWHPRKLEIQYSYMLRNPDVMLSGHSHNIGDVNYNLNGNISKEQIQEISLSRLLISNRFITPSAMIKRSCHLRFSHTQRYMEDYDLWIRVALLKVRIVKFELALASTFKPAFGHSGLSADLLPMEMGELKTYIDACLQRPTMMPLLPLLICYSLMKFFRRIIIAKTFYFFNK